MKKIISVMLTLVLCVAPIIGVAAVDAKSAETDAKKQVQIGVAEGTVTEVRNFYEQDEKIAADKKFVTVKDANEGITTFLVTKETYNITETALNSIKAGDKFSGFYDATLPVIMIYPPQYNAVAISVNLPEPKSVKVDHFDENLISSDNTLKLNVSEDTKIYNQSGEVYKGEIKNKRLVVLYTITTRSIPAQTAPEKVVILDSQTEEPQEPEQQQLFGSKTGVVTKVAKYYDSKQKVVKDKKFIFIKSEDGSEVNFLVTADTCFAYGKFSSIKKGDTFTGFYDAAKPVIEIYPPQYSAVAATVNLKKDIVKVDKFDKNLISSDNQLKLNVGKKTVVVKQNGKKYTGKLTNKNLAVIYNVSTKSIPAQTTPKKVIVLNALK